MDKIVRGVFLVLLLILPGLALAGGNGVPIISAPTLSEWGAVASAAILGAAGAYMLLRRR